MVEGVGLVIVCAVVMGPSIMKSNIFYSLLAFWFFGV